MDRVSYAFGETLDIAGLNFLVQEFSYTRHEVDHLDWFLKKIIASAVERLRFHMRKRAHRNDWDAVGLRFLAQG